MRTLATLCIVLSCLHEIPREWSRLTSIPNSEGFAGMFAGVSGGALIAAGGANFPDKRPWEGGKKVWYDSVFVLERPNGKWRLAGKLPRPLGYGISVTHRGRVVCVGGSDAERHYADAFSLELNAGQVVIRTLPPVPEPVANACGALAGDVLYIAGGQRNPDSGEASASVYRVDLTSGAPQWDRVPPIPGPKRILAVASASGGSFRVAGGAELAADGKRRFLRDVYRYDSFRGWKRMADMPYPVVAAPSPAPSDESGFTLLGGDDGSKVGFAQSEKHPGFRRTILRYDIKMDRWTESGELPAARVTTPCVNWKGRWVIPSGEMRPGVRSPEVWSWSPNRPGMDSPW